jgi:transposase
MTQAILNTLPRTIGIDLGSKKSSFCILGFDGEVEREGSVPMSRASVERFLAEQPASRVVVETCGVSRWTAGIARDLGHEVVIANSRRLALVTQSYRKSDRNDAYKLADLGQVRPRLLSPVHSRGDRSYFGQMHQRVRAQLVQIRTGLVNLVRGCARTAGYPVPKCSPPAFAKRCAQALPEELRKVLGPALAELESVNAKIAECDKETERLGQEAFPETHCLRQIAGVGPVLSLAFVCAVEDPTRFEDSRAVGAYFGLAPRSRQSGKKDPQLRISKRGDPEVRRLLVSAATYILGPFGPDCDLRRYGQRVAASGSQSAKSKARIAVARKLAALLHHIWVTGQVYQPLTAERASA